MRLASLTHPTLFRFFFLHLASGCGLEWWMDSSPALAGLDVAAANLRTILRGLLAVLGMWKLEPTRAMVLYNRINAIGGRIERMLIRFRAGRLWRRTGSATRANRSGAVRKANCTLPRRFGWLVRVGGWQAAGVGSQLQTVLNTPEMSELLAASPQAVRILRPLCRALAIDVPFDPAAQREAKPRTPRVRKPRPKPEPYKIPLPRGVISWARREGYRGI
jgi:hypothetical protein